MRNTIQNKIRRISIILKQRIDCFKQLPLHSTYSMERYFKKLEKYKDASDDICIIFYRGAFISLQEHRKKFPGSLKKYRKIK